jgi:hypothetical protein
MSDDLKPPAEHAEAPAHLLNTAGGEVIGKWETEDAPGWWWIDGSYFDPIDAADRGWTYIAPLYPLTRADNPPGEGVVVPVEWKPTEDQAKGGWRINVRVLERLQQTEWLQHTSLEGIEAALIEGLTAPRPAAPGDGEVEALKHENGNLLSSLNAEVAARIAAEDRLEVMRKALEWLRGGMEAMEIEDEQPGSYGGWIDKIDTALAPSAARDEQTGGGR